MKDLPGRKVLLFYAALLYKKKQGEQNIWQTAAYNRGRNKAGLQLITEFGQLPTNSAKFHGKLYSIKRKMIELWLSKAHFRKLTIYKIECDP
ncbi:hypothetical protein LCM00_18390 [Bacillus infantis]|uniref:hypothetical protein n=1 Tax=Bacillus infantis TaxID=324767 RepID=UPI001CD4DE82|nr:hypothetical protein [Bacillus infantis]MCA1041489.1 hypothetical protein [Bacillus infantis]